MRAVHQPHLDGLRRSTRGARNSRSIVLGQAASLLGDYVAYLTLPLYVLSLNDSATELGFTAALETLPLLLFGLVAGALLDRYTIKPILIAADLVRAGVFLMLAIGTASGTVELPLVLASAFAVGTMSVFFDSGLQTLLPRAVPDSLLVGVNSRIALSRTFAFTVGPALGGVIIATSGGFPLAFGVQAATFLVSALSILSVRTISSRIATATRPLLPSVVSGVKELLALRPLVVATLAASFANLVFAPLETLLVVYVRDYAPPTFAIPDAFTLLFKDQAAIGLFLGVQGLIGTLLLLASSRLAAKARIGHLFIGGLVLMGAGFGGMLMMGNFFGFIPAGFSLAGVGTVNIAFVTSRQRLSPPEYLGRITAASRTVAYATLPIGTVIGTAIAQRVGVQPVYQVGAVSVIIVGLLLLPTTLGRLSFPRRLAA